MVAECMPAINFDRVDFALVPVRDIAKLDDGPTLLVREADMLSVCPGPPFLDITELGAVPITRDIVLSN